MADDKTTQAGMMDGDPTALVGSDPKPEFIGPFRILQLIGEGGFGYVYMAQQTHPVKRRVALKVVKPGMDSRQVLARFESERQALAMMDHPNIAHVYDAGQTDQGRPYFAMELVRGMAITRYADQEKLSTRERLELFIPVCHAVQHAHLKGIVHRDLKPSNVMVTLHDGTPVVKVIDFGIAKAMNQELTDGTVFTEFRQFMGTPEYMAPEQAAMSGLDVDTRADVYSLGVLLYELTTGTTPLDAHGLRSLSLPEIQKVLQESEPPKPSTRLAKVTTGGSPATPRTNAEVVARQRGTDARSLRRTLAGDIDCIVMKAMEKDRRRRYETTAALAEDLHRYLSNEPILARPPSAVYRLRKFARRNRVALGATGIALYALLLTLAALSYGLVQARRERDLTAHRETVARAQLILTGMNAVRQYTTKNVRPALEAAADYANFKQEMVPGFAARQVFENFRKDERFADFLYKEASLNPTNGANRADGFETELLEKFSNDRESTEVSGTRSLGGVSTFYIARPMVVNDEKCLVCHTSPEKAPTKQIELYGRASGYGWKLHDVVAAQVVYVPEAAVQHTERSAVASTVLVVAGVSLVGVAGSLWLLLRRA